MHDTWKDMFVMGLPLAEKILRPIIVHKDRKSTRLNSSHTVISYAVFCLKKKKHKSPGPQDPKSRGRAGAGYKSAVLRPKRTRRSRCYCGLGGVRRVTGARPRVFTASNRS